MPSDRVATATCIIVEIVAKNSLEVSPSQRPSMSAPPRRSFRHSILFASPASTLSGGGHHRTQGGFARSNSREFTTIHHGPLTMRVLVKDCRNAPHPAKFDNPDCRRSDFASVSY